MATVSTRADECPAPPFQDNIDRLEGISHEQDQTEAKSKLAALKKLRDDVQQIETKYAKEYEVLEFAESQSATYEGTLGGKIQIKLSAGVKEKIQAIVTCAPRPDDLENEWKTARDKLPDLQSALAKAQNRQADAKEDYDEAADYKANQKDLDDLKTQGTKEFEAQNFRAAYFLVALEMKDRLKVPAAPKDFNTNLESKALKYNDAAEEVRKAKVLLDQATADSQKKKKDYEDAKSKRRANILKQIADEPFNEAANGAAALGTTTTTSIGDTSAV